MICDFLKNKTVYNRRYPLEKRITYFKNQILSPTPEKWVDNILKGSNLFTIY